MKNILLASIVVVAVLASIAATTVRYPVYVNAPTLVQSGSCITTSDGSVTQSFTTVYGSAPNVVVVQRGETTTTTNIITATTNQFIYRNSKATTTNIWIAVGAP